jgi:hypothetical protein
MGIMLALLALVIFAMPFIAALAHTYEGGAQTWSALFFYVLFAVPATKFSGIAVTLRGWREARMGYVTLAILYGIPLLVLIAAVVSIIFDAVRHKFVG